MEGLAFSPDGKVVCTAGRDGALRCFSAADGAPLGTYATEEPLMSVAFLSGGRALVAGSARGLLTVVAWPEITFVSEVRAHRDEVRALAVAPRAGGCTRAAGIRASPRWSAGPPASTPRR